MPDDDPKADPHARPFADFLVQQRDGALHSEMTDALHELVEAVRAHGKPGTITFTLKVKPAGRLDNAVMVTDDVKLKKPVGERGDSLFFVSLSGNLTRENPAQPRLPLREVGQTDVDDTADTDAKEATAP